MPDIEAIISNSVHEATGGEEGAAFPDAPATPSPEAPAVPAEGDISPTAATEVTPPAPDTPAEFDWEAAGLKKPEPGKDNRIPHSRVQKIIENKEKQLRELLAKERDEAIKAREEALRKELTPAQERLQMLEYADQLASSNPAEYMKLLARVNPEYANYVQRKADEAAAAAIGQPTGQDNDPEPGPDQKDANGTLYYSTEGFAKWKEWNTRAVTRAVEAKLWGRVEKEYGPLKEQARNAALYQQNSAKVAKMRQWAESRFGPLFEQSKDEIVAALKASKDPDVHFAQIVTDICAPKMITSEQKMREKILAELKTRPAAAAASTPSAAAAPKPEPSGDPISDAIRGAIRDSGLV